MTYLTDELLRQIRESSGRCYGHEGRAMADELLARRAAEREAKSAAAQPQYWPPLPGQAP